MFGLTNEEIEYLKNCSDDIRKYIEIEERGEHGNLEDLLISIDCYLTSPDCMYFDSYGENWYNDEGRYVQRIYDKIILWTYRDEDEVSEKMDADMSDIDKELFERLAR